MMNEDVCIVDLDTYEPTDVEILSWNDMMGADDQLVWDYDERRDRAPTTEQEEVDSFREWQIQRRGENYPIWAMVGSRVVGMVGVNRFTGPTRQHCGEVGFGVAKAFTRRGIGGRLLTAAIDKARQVGLKRLEADCFADNVAAIALLRKGGFKEEGLRVGAIWKDGVLRDQRLFGRAL